MRATLLAAIALVSGCLAESAGPLGASHPTASYTNAVVCTEEAPTGSHIKQTVCREPGSPENWVENPMWRSRLPGSPFLGGSRATDMPGLRVYR